MPGIVVVWLPFGVQANASSCKSMQVCKVAKQSELKYATLPLLSRFLVPCLSLRIIGHFPTPGKIELALQEIMITEFFLHFCGVPALFFVQQESG